MCGCALFRGHSLPNGQLLSNHEILFALKLNVAHDGLIKSFVEVCAGILSGFNLIISLLKSSKKMHLQIETNLLSRREVDATVTFKSYFSVQSNG